MKNHDKILRSFKPKDELNTKIWNDGGKKMDKEVRDKLLEIANEYIEFINLDIVITDVVMTGSLANFNWSDYSDVDLHLIVNFNQFPSNQIELYKEYFNVKKILFNLNHDITIFGYDVELYTEDDSEVHISSGVYSILFDEWMTKPKKENVEIDLELIKTKSKQWMSKIDTIITSLDDSDFEYSKKVLDALGKKIKKFRQSGLDDEGEYSNENMIFKVLRRSGYLDKVREFKNKVIDKNLTLKQ